MSERKLIIVGTGGFSQDITDHFLREGKTIFGYVGRIKPEHSKDVKQNYLGTLEEFTFNPDLHQVFVALGENPGRKEAYDLLCKKNLKPLTFIHPSAIVMRTASIGQGVYVGPYCIIGSNSFVGENTFLNKFVNIGHDAQIGKSVTVYPYGCIGGNAKVDDNVLISTRSTVYPSIEVGCNSIIASNTEIRKNLAERTFIMSKNQQIKKSL